MPHQRPSVEAELTRGSYKLGAPGKDWDNPEFKGVTGTVVWCDRAQKGYLKLTGLPANNPETEQYQLWIVDSRGMGQRISGAIFNSSGGETVVAIEPGIPIKSASAFAVTIE